MWLGFDLGTQSVRAMAVSEMGHVLGQSSQPLTSRREGPRHEQDPEEWWRAVVNASRATLADLPASSVRGLAVDGTSGTLLLVDSAKRSHQGLCMTTRVQRTKRAVPTRPAPPSGPRSDIACSRRGLYLSCFGCYASIPA